MSDLPNKLLLHNSVEYAPDSTSDKILIGYLNLTSVFLTLSNEYKLKIGNILPDIFYNFLFATGVNELNSSLNIPKCKTNDSRIAAYNLIVQLVNQSGLVNLDSNNLKKLNILLDQQMSDISPTIGWEFDPEKYIRSTSGYVGLKNQASTCYMNSLLQQFFMMPDFRKGILNATSTVSKNPEDNLLYQLQILFGYLSCSEKQYYDTAPFCASYKDENVSNIFCFFLT